MRKKITIALALLIILFSIGGAFSFMSLRKASATLDKLISMYEVDIIREELMSAINQVRADVQLGGSPFAQGTAAVTGHLDGMEKAANACTGCHHVPETERMLRNLQERTREYRGMVRGAFLAEREVRPLLPEEEAAITTGNALARSMHDIIDATHKQLMRTNYDLRTAVARSSTVSVTFLFTLSLVLLVLIGLLTRWISVPVNMLMEAMRQVKAGRLDHRVGGLKDEFGILATGFNEMVGRIQAHETEVARHQEFLEEQVAQRTAQLARDLDEKKGFETALVNAAHQWRTSFDAIGDCVCLLDADGTVLRCNLAMADFLKCKFMDVLERKIDDLVYAPAGLDARANGSRIRALAGREMFTVAIADRWFNVTIDPIMDEAGAVTGCVHIMTDVTESRRGRLRLAESEERYRLIAENAHDVIWTADMNLRFTFVSPAIVHLRGFTIEEAMAQTIEDALTPDSRALAMKTFAEEVARDDQPGVAPTRSRTLELEEYRKDGSTIWTETTVTFLRGPDGRPTGILGVTRDITDRRRLEQQLIQSQKMDAVGRLAGGVAHDFNNILSVIKSYSEFMLNDIPQDSPLRPDAEEIKKSADRAAALTRQLLAFSRKQLVNPEVLAVNDVINNLSKMLNRLIGEHIRMSLQFDPDAGEVFMDPSQLEQVLVNLVVNARDAMPKGGKLIIETTRSVVAPDNPVTLDDVAPGEYVVISVADTGVGMDKDLQKKIFEPFFTTKPVGKGTGLGLPMVYGAARQNGGFVNVYSEPGLGTTFRVYLKRRAAEDAKRAAPEAAKAPKGKGELILLVEDEEAVRRAVRKMLETNGYRVVEAADGQTAITIVAERPAEIALVVSDIVMPGMSGIEMVKRMRQENPGLKALHMSGYTDEILADQGVTDDRTYILTKPFEQSVLLAKVREIVEKN